MRGIPGRLVVVCVWVPCHAVWTLVLHCRCQAMFWIPGVRRQHCSFLLACADGHGINRHLVNMCFDLFVLVSCMMFLAGNLWIAFPICLDVSHCSPAWHCSPACYIVDWWAMVASSSMSWHLLVGCYLFWLHLRKASDDTVGRRHEGEHSMWEQMCDLVSVQWL